MKKINKMTQAEIVKRMKKIYKAGSGDCLHVCHLNPHLGVLIKKSQAKMSRLFGLALK